MAEKFFLFYAVILNILMLTLLAVELTRLSLIPIIIYTLMHSSTVVILLVSIDEYKQSREQ